MDFSIVTKPAGAKFKYEAKCRVTGDIWLLPHLD